MNLMKKTTLLAVAVILFASCKKQTINDQDPVSDAVRGQVKALGFSTDNIQKTDEGYLVEGDIVLTEENLKGMPTSHEIIHANEEHYRTTNLVTGLPRNLTIKVSSGSPAFFSTALATAVSRYNALNLQVRFTVVSSSSASNITVQTFYQVSNTLGSAGFPSGGNPYPTIRMNTYWYSSATADLPTVIAHEMGHCIGFRHTDYMNRSYSCGGSAVNEGSAGIGAIYIPGTPTGGSANSWMLACSNGTDRPFTTADRTALNYVY
jgi:hypothetical protein